MLLVPRSSGLLWDMYQLKNGVQQLAGGGEEGANQLREIANQLEEGLIEFTEKNVDDNDDEDENIIIEQSNQ